MIRVALADDDATFRHALVDVLASDPRFELTGVAGSAGEVIEIVRETSPDLVLLDVRMPGGGVEAARAIAAARRDNGPAIVALSAQAGVGVVVDMLRAGAVGYLVKGRLGSDLTDLLVRCADGEVVLAAPGGAKALRQLIGTPTPAG